LTWDSEGHLGTVAEGTQNSGYLYDADGNRLISHDPTGATLYLPGEELHLAPGAATPTATRYYTWAGSPIAVRTPAKLSWLGTDNQNTAQIAIDATTQDATERRQTPYGTPRGTPPTSWPDIHGYLNGPQDPTGLTHLGAREYDPTTGRFLTVDPLLAPTDPQQLNGYSYAANTPTTASDPTGLMYTDTEDLSPTTWNRVLLQQDFVNPFGGGAPQHSCGIGCRLGRTVNRKLQSAVAWGLRAGYNSPHTDNPVEDAARGAVKTMCGGNQPLHAECRTEENIVGKAAAIVADGTGVSDFIDCLNHPSISSCAQAAAAVAVPGDAPEIEAAESVARAAKGGKQAERATADGSKVVSRDSGSPEQTLFHYTDEAGQKGILDSGQLNPSLRSVNRRDARYGDGQYLSDIKPGTQTCAQLSRCFIGQPFQGSRFTHYVEINVGGLNVVQGRPGVFVVPGDTPLDLTGRIVSWGTN
jgi:RHS repeat-associated protein